MDNALIIPLHDANEKQIGNCVVKDISIVQTIGGAANVHYTVVRTYKGESEQTYYLCEGWLEGYSAAKRKFV